MACPYAFILGVPEQGVHAPRIGGYARNDILGTIGLAILTAYIMKISFLYSLVVWFVLGEILHYLFGVQTAFLTSLGIKSCPENKS
jgi:hypothetical protein